MEIFLYILAKTVQIFLSLISLAMLMRVILQFFVDTTKSRFYALCVAITEPVIVPFRLLFAKLNIAQRTPIDVPFLVAYLTLSIVTSILPLI